MPFGYHGCYLRIDVSSRQRRARAAGRRRCCASSSAAAAWAPGCCSTKARRTCDPLSPEAPLVFAFSPLVGSPLTTSAKFAVVSKSPLTERFNDSLASSGFALAGKRCGCDAIVIVGRAPELSVLIIDDGDVRLEPAAESRGADVPGDRRGAARAARRRLSDRVDRSGRRAPGALRHDLARRPPCRPRRQRRRARQQEHQGDRRARDAACEWAHPRELTALSRDLSKRSFGPATAKYRELGTATNLLTFNRFGTLPTRNFQSGTFEEAASLSPEQLSTTRAKTRDSCVACTIGCEHIYAHRRRAACASSTRACSRSARCAASATPTPCCARRSAATSSASTRSAPAARSRSRWSASSAACSTSRG